MELKVFVLKEEHLTLLRNMHVSWNDCEFGAPTIDCKRPYGNSSVHEDIAKILGIEGFVDSDDEISFSKEQICLMNDLHEETEIALQIILSVGKFEPGIYCADKYGDNWYKKSI